MRYATMALVFTACGTKTAAHDDGATAGSDIGPLTVDAPALAACTPTSGMTMTTRKVGHVPGSAILATSPPNDGRLFVIEQGGAIYLFIDEQLATTPFLDISAKVTAGGEQGLLGLAFHPKYAQNNYFYVWYTAINPDATDTANPWVDVLERYTASAADLNKADPASGQIILSIPDFATNHNGGMLEFGADGYLYAGTGDGGGAGDLHRNAQNLDPASADCVAHGNLCQTRLGKILRIDVDHPANGNPYGIPADNPFPTSPTPEAFIVGTRNPWRWSFDRMTGDMWIADVGQSTLEELDVLPAGQQAGVNLGWSMWEATSCFGNYTCTMTGMTFPLFTHPTHGSGWCAIIGGQVYRGSCYPDIVGDYYFSDNCSGQLWRGHLETNGTVTAVQQTGSFPASPSSIHADARGELYETTTAGDVYHLEAGP